MFGLRVYIILLIWKMVFGWYTVPLNVQVTGTNFCSRVRNYRCVWILRLVTLIWASFTCIYYFITIITHCNFFIYSVIFLNKQYNECCNVRHNQEHIILRNTGHYLPSTSSWRRLYTEEPILTTSINNIRVISEQTHFQIYVQIKFDVECCKRLNKIWCGLCQTFK